MQTQLIDAHIFKNYTGNSCISDIQDFASYIHTLPNSLGIDVSAHSTNIILYPQSTTGLIGPGIDGVIAQKTDNITLALRTADCAPIIFSTSDGLYYGIIHVGWKGLVGDILGNFKNLLQTIGYNFADIYVWIGPMAAEGFEFGKQDFEKYFISYYATREISLHYTLQNEEKIIFDFRASVISVLQYLGCTNIKHSQRNTLDSNETLPSWRKGNTQRIITTISPS